MQELQNKINGVEKDVAVLQVEVRNFGAIMTRLDDAISSMTQVSNNLERLLIVHEERIRNTHDNLESHKRDMGVVNTDMSNRIDAISKSVNSRLDSLEKWRWHIGGVYAALVVVAGFLGKITGLW
jgi:hypothetical protein